MGRSHLQRERRRHVDRDADAHVRIRGACLRAELWADATAGDAAMFQTEHEFTLPLGYVDTQGNLHREGVMRLATAADEILPLKDPRVQQNEASLAVIVLARVITKLRAPATTR